MQMALTEGFNVKEQLELIGMGMTIELGDHGAFVSIDDVVEVPGPRLHAVCSSRWNVA